MRVSRVDAYVLMSRNKPNECVSEFAANPAAYQAE